MPRPPDTTPKEPLPVIRLLLIAALALLAWTVLALPLGILVGRRLRRAGAR